MPEDIDIDFVYHGPLFKTQKAWIHPINQETGSKPCNVLWTSPVNSATGESEWIEYCRREGYKQDYYEEQKWHIVPNGSCRLLTLYPDSEEMRRYTIQNKSGATLDFEAIAKDYDALYVPQQTIDACGGTKKEGLLAQWDVPSCVFLAPEYTVMNDEMYHEYLLGRRKLSEKSNYAGYNPEIVQLHQQSIPQMQFKTPTDNSAERAIADLQQLLTRTSGGTSSGRDKIESINAVIEFVQNGGMQQNVDYVTAGDMMYLDVMEIMLKHGMKPDQPEFFGLQRNPEYLKLFLQYGADPDKALQRAMHNAEREIALKGADETSIRNLKLCLSAGANPNLPDADGKTPLMMTMHPEQVVWLLEAGANPSAKDNDGKSVAEHVAERQIIYGNCVVSEKLLTQALTTSQLKEQMRADASSAAKSILNAKSREAVNEPQMPPLSLLLSKARER